MLNCPECDSEHVFAATCLSCGHVIGKPSYDVSWSGYARTGPMPIPAAPGAKVPKEQDTKAFTADHFISLDISKARTLTHAKSPAAALHSPTTGAMAQSAKETENNDE